MLRPGLSALLFVLAPLVAQDPRLVVDLAPNGSGAASRPILGPGPRPGELLVALDDGVRGTELWRTDGTAAGTVLVSELVPGARRATFLTGIGDASGCDFVADRGAGQEMWRSDGTAAGTQLLFSALSIGATFLTPPQLGYRLGNQWLFNSENQLFLSDGSASGTAPLGVGPSYAVLTHGGSIYTNELASMRVHVITPTSPPTVV